MSARNGHVAVVQLLCGKEVVDLDVKDYVRTADPNLIIACYMSLCICMYVCSSAMGSYSGRIVIRDARELPKGSLQPYRERPHGAG